MKWLSKSINSLKLRAILWLDKRLDHIEEINARHGGDLATKATHQAAISATIIRADGTREELGNVSEAKLTRRGARQLSQGGQS